MGDETFSYLLEQTFTSSSIQLEKYFNLVMSDNEAFTKISYYFNKLEQYLNNNDIVNAKKVIACILHDYNTFNNNIDYGTK